MNSVLYPYRNTAPLLFRPPSSSRIQASTLPSKMNTRKRKQEHDTNDDDTLMSPSPSSSPSLATSHLPQSQRRQFKRPRTNATGRPLILARLLETLSADELRETLKTICDRNPYITQELPTMAPRPSVESVMHILTQYENSFRTQFPFGSPPESDYAYNRVKETLASFLDALRDFTPTFLPPNETRVNVSLNYLHLVTDMIHRLPNWTNSQNNRQKEEAYEDISKAWANVIREAAKRGAGIQLRTGQWDQKIYKHHQSSGNRLQETVRALENSTNWLGQEGSNLATAPSSSDLMSIHQQLLNGSYGAESVSVGTW